MKNKYNILGIIIICSSFFSFIDPNTWFISLPIIFALGCIVYGIGDIINLISLTHKIEK